MNFARAITMAFEHGPSALATAGDVGSEAAKVLADGKVEPGECIDAADAVVDQYLDRTGSGDDVIVHVPLDAANQASRVHNAVEAIREHAVQALSDRKLTKREAKDLAVFAARRILDAIPSKEAQGA